MTTAPDDSTEFRAPEETPTIRVEPSTAIQLTPGAILGGRYRIVSLLGRGGMGEVYRADDLRLGQPVALKFLARRRAENERLLHDEVRIGRQISHPNVCRLYDIAEVDERIFITMEYVDGEDLASLLRRVGRLAPDKALSVARDLCAGLAAAHELGVIHRDLKPGNVMIDGRGRARITDFGLAVAEEAREQTTSGTPAYMAPEQLAGEPSSVRSDIFALGLILYEVFTGRRVFGGASLSEIVRQQRERLFTPPRAIVPDIEPPVERAILRCLEKDPNARPASVPELMRELPSYDPIAAALAAGETPSAGMVAASAQRGDLGARTAWLLLAAALIAVIATAAIASRTTIAPRESAKPPEVLLERARAAVTAARVGAPVTNSGFAYSIDPQSHHILFFYRQSPRSMRARGLTRQLTDNDPPFDYSGMARVKLDSRGKLYEIAVVPPQRERNVQRAPFDWSPLFALAEIDPRTLRPVAPEWAAPADSDEKQAWLIGDTQRRIEAATYHGLPVWFSVIEPWKQATRMTPLRVPPSRRFASGLNMVLLIVLPIVVLFLAWRNTKRGSGDRKGALRLAVFSYAIIFVSYTIQSHQPVSVQEQWVQLSYNVSVTAFWAAVLWVGYLAIEPLARRRWPWMLISWSRLLEGRWRDPMVGRDVLIGAAAGSAVAVCWGLTAAFPGATPLGNAVEALAGMRHVVAWILRALFEALFKPVFTVVLLLVLFAITRRLAVAALLGATLTAAFYLNEVSGPLAVRIAFGMIVGATVYLVLLRFGLLALVASGFFTSVLWYVPLTIDVSSWYFGQAMFAMAILAAIAWLAFRVSLAGKPFLPRMEL